MPIAAIWVLIAAVAMTACAAPPANTRSREDMTQRERDSIVGASVLPGARGVSSALKAADISGARNAAVDPASQDN
ncbi:MAG: hypothetical protein WKF55_12605 [Gemmatimonadaceae bacterium]